MIDYGDDEDGDDGDDDGDDDDTHTIYSRIADIRVHEAVYERVEAAFGITKHQ